MATGQAYQVASAAVQGNEVVLTLSPANPALASGDPISVSLVPALSQGYSSAVEDNYQQASQSGPVTQFSPSDPAVSLGLTNGTLSVTLSNGSAAIASGQSVVVVPQGAVSLGALRSGAVYSTVTTSAQGQEVLTVPCTSTGSTSLTVYFDGVEQTLQE
jgi:hypothetical protein